MSRSGPSFRVGCSGYDYNHWRGKLYPEDARKKDWFSIYAASFDCVEINNTFYHLPQPSTFDEWRDCAPPNFIYALKLSRFATHMKHLKDPQSWLASFLKRAERLRSRLGPILVQLPPQWDVSSKRLDDFLTEAPRRHRWAIEFRNATWLRDEVYEILRSHGALCIHDLIDRHPMVITASWTYLRYHGHDAKYAGAYSSQKLSADARRIRACLSDGLDVYAFFNNDLGGHAVEDAKKLRQFVTRR